MPSGPSCATIVHTRHTAAIVANISGQVANNKPVVDILISPFKYKLVSFDRVEINKMLVY